jgi:hypothetical protein
MFDRDQYIESLELLDLLGIHPQQEIFRPEENALAP